jgi:IPT/TIG domain
MRNPLLNSSAKTWMQRTLSNCRDVIQRLRSDVGLHKPPQAWVIALLCVSLAGCISLVELARRVPSKDQGKGTIAAAMAPATDSQPAAAKPEKKSEKESPAETSKKAPRKAKNGKPVQHIAAQEKKERSLVPVPLKPVVLAPPADLDEAKEGEKEDSDISRKRQSWFFDQRAYPNKHIPNGAYQKALAQRDAMRAQQRAAASSKSVADAVISFPGDALWHLMGPQPVNNPFGQNGGFPTASGRITAIAVDPSDATGNTVYVGGAAGGVWKTTNGGSTWTVLTDTQPSLAVGSITIDPNSCSPGPCTTIYVGTGEENFNGDAFYGAGILKSTNGGSTWTQMGGSTFAQVLGPEIGGAYIGQIAVQPGNANIVLAAVSFFANGTIGGIYRSTDAGNTWTEDAAPRGLGATSVFFESTSNTGATATAWMAMGDPFGESVNGIYKSTDSGTTWTKQTSVLPTTNLGRITLGYAPSTSGSSATVYAAIADSSTTSSALLGLFKTTNGGTAWTSVTGPSVSGGFCAEQCFYDMAIGVHPTNPNVVVLGGGPGGDNFTSLFESTNGGTSWTPATGAAGDFAFGATSAAVHVDTHAIVFTASGATLYVGDDGGIWSTNTPQPAAGVSPTWTDLNAGLAITQFYPGTTAAVSDENYGFGGTQDNDTELFSGSLAWQNEFICGDGGFTAIDQNIPTTIWATCDSGAGAKVKKAVFNGQFVFLPAANQNIPGFDIAETAITNSGDAMQFIPPLALDDSNPNNLYFGTCRVWMTNNAESSLANSFIPLTPSWTPISGDLSAGNATVTTACPSPTGAGNITNMEVAHSNDAVIVAGTSNGKVWESATGGADWNEIDAAPLPNRAVTAVRTKRSDGTGAIVYATFSGFDCGGTCSGTTTAGHVFKTTTAGTTNTWVNITGDLPDIPVNDIIVDHESNPTHDALYIATDVGVFYCPNPEATTATCANWTVIGDGLPNSPVLSLAMRRSSRILRAATHGRSVWQIQLTDVFPPALAAISSVTPAAVDAVTSTTGSTSVTVTGLNFSAGTQVQFSGITTGVTTTFVNTTQLNVSISNSLLQFGGVYPITLLDSQGVDSGSALGTGGAPFTVMNPLLKPLTMTPTTAMAYTAVPFQFTAAAGEPFLQNSVIAFYDNSNPPVLQFQLPISEVPTLSGGGTVYKLTTAITDLTTPGTYQVIPYNPEPGGSIDALALAAAAGGPVPFIFTVTANPGPVIQVSSPLELAVNAVGANSGTTYNFFQVSNLVGATLNITAATITGTNAANFKFIAPGGAPTCNFESTGTVSVSGGSFCFFGLEYTAGTPPGNANSVATLNITDNASGSPQAFPITGVILPASSAFVFLSSVPFGPVAVGATSPTMNATLSNFGTSSVSVTSAFSITGTNQADFHIVPFVSNGDGNSACPSTLPFVLPAVPTAGYACDVTLTFTPSLPASAETAQLNVTASVTVTTATPNLTGTGIEITSISPSIIPTGGPAFTLTVNGGGFASSAVVNVNGNARLTTFVNANQLLASIPATDIATAGSLAITVTTPVPGGTTSEPKTLIVAAPSPASNDNIEFAADAITIPWRTTEDTTQATVNTGGFTDPTPSCAPGTAALGGRARSVWFEFIAPANGTAVVNTRFSNYTTILSAFTGSPSSLTPVAGACATGNVPAAGASPAESLIKFTVTNGTVYFIMVTDASAGGAGGTLTYSLDFASAVPSNDDNATPTVIAPASLPYSNTENTIRATANTNGHNDPVPPCASGAGLASSGQANSVWYSFTPTSNGTVTADTLTSPYQTILNVTSGTPTGTQVACNVSAAAGIAQSQVSFAATSGTTYFFMVSAFLGDGGTTNFHLTFSTGPANPAPTLTSISPTSATAGGAAFTLTLTGTNFIAGSLVNFGANPQLTPTSQTATQLQVTVPATDIATGGTVSVSVFNPAPGGGTSSAQTFTINNPAPTITTLSPSSATAGGAGFTLTVNGTNFVAGSTVNFNGSARTTTFVNATQLTAAITAADIATAGTPSVTVTNAAPGGGTSAGATFTVNNPVPTITSLNPNGTTAGGSAFTLTVNGAGYVSGSQVKFNGNARTTTFVSATQLTAAILATDIATVGTANVTVTNAAPGGGTTANFAFTISSAPNPVPTLTSLSPTNGILGQPVTLTLTGTNFISGSIVNFGTFADSGGTVSNGGDTLTINIPGAQLAASGNINVTVTNPAPGGGTSAVQVFQIFNPVPTITSLSPSSAIVGGAAFTLTVNGTNFINGAVVDFNGNNRVTTFVSSTQITAAILASDLVSPGTALVSVANPAPTNGSSATVNFQINNPVPTATSLSPTSTTAGGPQFTLTVNGTNFVQHSSVLFNGALQVTNFVSATQLTATIPAAAILTPGTVNVAVSNPTPGGGNSGNLTFTINNPAPTITTLSPTNATAGGAAFTLTVSGTGFVSGSSVKFNGTAVTTTFVSAAEVTAAITAAEIAAAGTFPVTVTNPAPGGGTSTAVNFTVNNPAPTITTLSPTSASAGGAAFTLTVNGTGFVNGSIVKFNGTAATTTFVSATQVTAAITAAEIATAGSFPVTVVNAAPGGGTSAAVNFTVNNPAPTITTLSPTSATAGGAAFTLTVNGTNLDAASVVNFNGAARTTTFVSSTQVTAAITAGDIAAAGTPSVTVTNPAPGGGTSAGVTFTINNPVPTITSLSPTGIVAGGAAFTLTVNGTNFVSTSVVKFNGNAKTTTFVSATQLTAAILASDITTSGSANVTVTNATPGGGTTANFVFNISSAPNPVPTLASISPTSATAGGAAFTLTVTGTNFVASSVVNFNGVAQTTTVVSATQLTASITAAEIATAGSLPVTVTNPAPGGGTTAAINFAVNNPTPAITTLSPTGALVGGAGFTLMVNGTGFVNGSTVNYNGSARTTTFVNATQVTAAITAADIAAVGAFPVTVTNLGPGGGTSTAVSFNVTNPPPTITTLSPTSATAGGAAFTLTVNGTAFVNGATVTFNGTAAATTFVSSTQLTAAITTAQIATSGTVNVTVTNPAPGGGTSGAATFTINNPTPTITTLSPTTATAGGAAFVLTVNGGSYVSASVVNFNGKAAATTFVSASQLTAAITAADITTAGAVNVTVTNPAPGGGTSTAAVFTINNPVPTIATLSPTSATVGGATFTLTVNGTNFAPTSVVNFNGAAQTTTFVSATQLTASITTAEIATAGTVNVSVTTPAPGGGSTGSLPFAINNPVPTITTLAPNNATAGGAAFTLTVNGTNFVAASQVSFNGGLKPTTFKSATQLTAAIAATDILNSGLVNVTVTTPGPGGGTSTPAAQFTINNAQPTLASLSPTSALAGSAAFTLTINGNGFVNGATVTFNEASPAKSFSPVATFVSSAKITAAITAAEITTADRYNVTVTNPLSSGPSVALTFTVTNPVPTLTTLGQTHAPGGTAFTLTVNGTNFVATSVVNFGTKAEPTTLVSPTQVTAAIPATDVATAGPVNVTVVNPAPGGGPTPTSVAFTVDGFSLAGPGSAVTVMAGATATIPITITPTTNGFPNQVTFSVTGLPAHATLTPLMATPGNAKSTVNLMIVTTSRSAAPPASPMDQPLTPMLRFLLTSWIATLLAGLYVALLIRRSPRFRRYAAVVPLALLIVSGVVLAGCASAMHGTPAGTSQLTVTATSGTLSQSTQATLTVQ